MLAGWLMFGMDVMVGYECLICMNGVCVCVCLARER
jgi:hypothetical protein